MLDQAYVKEAFNYDPMTGVVTWKTRPVHHFATETACKTTNAKCAGKNCGYTSKMGYIRTSLIGNHYVLHRLIWLWMYGCMPDIVDHINGKKADNRICNLRDATESQNHQNALKRPGATSKLKGVSWSAGKQRWKAGIKHERRSYFLGYFHTEHEAHKAYCIKGAELFGEFFNPG